ncbi:MAG: ATP-binding protein [Ignavibacteriales bacterium]|nr:MAG: ATP-binding protein [Ignavibacteriales bacterium]
MTANSYTIPTEKIIERLVSENPWWKSKSIDDSLNRMKRRLYFDLIFPQIKDISLRRTILLMGPRRVGKTVMLYHAIQELIKKNAAPDSIFFVGIDNPLYINMGLEELLHLAVKASGRERMEGNYVFFDEIQYLKDWERHLKVLTDRYPKTKFVVSGSAAAALRLRSTESGAGRFHDFILPPLTFQEFLYLRDMEHLVQPTEILSEGKKIPFYKSFDIKALNEQFFRYINYGGYPEILFDTTVRNDLPEYIKNDIIDKVLLRDLPGIYGIRDVQELNRFFTYLAYNTGKEFSPQTIAKDSGLKTEVIKRYIEYLEAAFLINVVTKVDENARYFKRITGFKVYLTNSSLRTALFAPVAASDDESGSMVETAIYSQWMHRGHSRLHYAKWKTGRKEGEVDMVQLHAGKLKPEWALEIKWSNRYVEKPHELKSLLSFCSQNKLSAATITTIDKQTQIVHDGIELNFLPASLYAYAAGVDS